jgi:hypothetical protein
VDKKENKKRWGQGWRTEYGDFDDDQRTPDNVIFKFQDDDNKIIDDYKITDGKTKWYNQNLLRNFPHTSSPRKKPIFPLFQDFYNQPKTIVWKGTGIVKLILHFERNILIIHH